MGWGSSNDLTVGVYRHRAPRFHFELDTSRSSNLLPCTMRLARKARAISTDFHRLDISRL